MAGFREGYSSEEDATILSMVNEVKAEGLPLKSAYVKIADELGRPVSSVANRYRRIASISSGVLSESELVVAKLKALKRDRERSAEKTGAYKAKYNELLNEHDKLKRKYKALMSEHQTLINTVKEALGEDINANVIV